MSFAKVKLLLFSILFLLSALVLLLEIIGLICPYSLWAHNEGTPQITVRNNDFLCTGISQVVADENNIYVLFGTYSVVQVYSMDGVYQYTVSVYNHMNGVTRIAAKDDCLYVRDKIGNIYAFEGRYSYEFLPRQHTANKIESTAFYETNPDYVVKNGSVWRCQDGEASRCVIKRPAWLSIYQNSRLTLILFVFVIFAGIILFFPRRNKS